VVNDVAMMTGEDGITAHVAEAEWRRVDTVTRSVINLVFGEFVAQVTCRDHDRLNDVSGNYQRDGCQLNSQPQTDNLRVTRPTSGNAELLQHYITVRYVTTYIHAEDAYTHDERQLT